MSTFEELAGFVSKQAVILYFFVYYIELFLFILRHIFEQSYNSNRQNNTSHKQPYKYAE